MPRPVVALVGRPNVGKSTLFNRLIGEHRAVVHEAPGTTRDRLYGIAEWGGREFTLVDTGGIGPQGLGGYAAEVLAQAQEAVRQADVIVFVVDAQAGPVAADQEVADLLRRARKPLLLAANKAEGKRALLAAPEFYALGMGDPIPVSALHGTGTGDLLDGIVDALPPIPEEAEAEVAVAVAIVGRPNVGKSSLLNALLGQERAIVSDIPGTTRDAVDTLLERDDERILLIDTAGIRRRGRIEPGVERFSVLRAVRAIERADVAVLVLDATAGMTAQDTHVASFVQEAEKGLVLVVNKWDLVAKTSRTMAEHTEQVRRAFNFAPWAPLLFISARTGQRVERVLETVRVVQAERQKRVPTSRLNEVVREAVLEHRLTERGRALKVYYSTQGGVEPPTFVLFVNDPKLVHFSYQRYLENRIRAAFGFEGTPLKLVFRGHREE
ncbi:MAG: ribosome biogenesis GTPase Der [Chloroflexi bacterium]|nr:ribosome biogenesis GTPase Der [Chloroflexota bacterium]